MSANDEEVIAALQTIGRDMPDPFDDWSWEWEIDSRAQKAIDHIAYLNQRIERILRTQEQKEDARVKVTRATEMAEKLLDELRRPIDPETE